MKKDKLSLLSAIFYLAFGCLIYFGYYVLIQSLANTNPFEMPYLVLSVYFAICTLLFPISAHKLSIMKTNAERHNIWVSLAIIPQTLNLIAYIFAVFIAPIKLEQ